MNKVTLHKEIEPRYTEIGDHLQARIPPKCVIKPTMSIQPSIPPGMLSQVPPLIGGCKLAAMSPLQGGR